MTKEEAKRKLDFDSLLERREKSRIFGNIDTDDKRLSSGEIIELVMIEIDFSRKVKEAFEMDSSFYKEFIK